jgi:hypothetical protein
MTIDYINVDNTSFVFSLSQSLVIDLDILIKYTYLHII